MKKPKPPPPSGKYRAMWLYAMFDLPTKTQAKRRAYARFRKLLLKQGFCQLQYSIYARYYANEESSDAARSLIKRHLPGEGQVRLLAVTDRQFGKQQVFHGKKREKPEDEPDQILLF